MLHARLLFVGSIRIRSSFTGTLKPENKRIKYLIFLQNPNLILLTKGKKEKKKNQTTNRQKERKVLFKS